jgi:hypothetical protein
LYLRNPKQQMIWISKIFLNEATGPTKDVDYQKSVFNRLCFKGKMLLSGWSLNSYLNVKYLIYRRILCMYY